MPKENELTNQRELTEQELEFVAGGFPDVMEWFFGPYFSLLLNDGSNCPASVCGTHTLTQRKSTMNNSITQQECRPVSDEELITISGGMMETVFWSGNTLLMISADGDHY